MSAVSADLGTVRFSVAEGVGWLELDRPTAGNARNQQMREELLAVYEAVPSDEQVHVLVLTGVGDKFFCAGMDLKEADGSETPSQRRARLTSGRDIEALAALPVPTIAAINGYALGGGLEMALACDLRIAVEDASMGLPEVTRGLIPGGGATQRLPALIGPALAYELLYLGTPVDGVRAERIGLVNRCVPAGQLRTATEELARQVAAHPAAPLRMIKQSVLGGLEGQASSARADELDRLLTLLADREAST